jgi:hypothetical protein
MREPLKEERKHKDVPVCDAAASWSCFPISASFVAKSKLEERMLLIWIIYATCCLRKESGSAFDFSYILKVAVSCSRPCQPTVDNVVIPNRFQMQLLLVVHTPPGISLSEREGFSIIMCVVSRRAESRGITYISDRGLAFEVL